MVDFTKQSVASKASTVDQGLRSYMQRVYNYMAGALALTGVVAFAASGSEAIMSLFYLIDSGYIVGMKPLGWVVTFAPLVVVLMLGFKVHTMSEKGAQMALWGFSALMGLSLASIFLVYTGASITRVFFITASTFGAMSLWGYTTKKDLSGWGSFLMMGVIGIIIASIVNIFLQSSGLHFAVSILGVLIFTGLTAYDTQRIKQTYYLIGADQLGKAAVMGALSLYLDFINLFIMLLRFFGERR